MSSSPVRRLTGGLLVLAAVAFAAAATVLSSTFDWPDVLRRPPAEVLTRFRDGGAGLVWTWFAVAWTYALLLVPVLLLPRVLRDEDHALLPVATFLGAASVVVSVIGFLRWVFVVPVLAGEFHAAAGDPVGQQAVAAAYLAQHQFGGALLGEHLGQVLGIAWSFLLSLAMLRSATFPAWLGALGVAASGLYLLNQGEILATAVPGFPVLEPAGLLGSSAWAVWIAATGVTLWRTTRLRPASVTTSRRAT
jgi:hypothetical protein